MCSTNSEFISTIQDQYLSWFGSAEQAREINCQCENVDFKIILNRGRWIYPAPNCQTPAVVEDTVNIGLNNEKIKKIFYDFLVKDGDVFRFPHDKSDKFQIRFFTNEPAMRNELIAEEKRLAPYESPRWGLIHECILS